MCLLQFAGGASIDVRDVRGRTPLYYTLASGNRDVVQVLLPGDDGNEATELLRCSKVSLSRQSQRSR